MLTSSTEFLDTYEYVSIIFILIALLSFLYNDYSHFLKVIIFMIILYFIWRNVYCSLDTAVANDITATNIDNETNRNRTPICALHLFLTIFVAHFYKHKQKWDFFIFFWTWYFEAQYFNLSTLYRISFIKSFVYSYFYIRFSS